MVINRLIYPAKFVYTDDGYFVVTFRDIPEAITQGSSFNGAVDMAIDALITSFDFYIDDNRDLPKPSKFERWEIGIEVELPEALSTFNRV